MPQGLTCDEVHDAAAGFALDILDIDSRAEVSAHLRLCPSCRRQVAGMQESAARLLDLDSWAAPSAPPGERPAAERFPDDLQHADPAAGELADGRLADRSLADRAWTSERDTPGRGRAGEPPPPLNHRRRRIRLAATAVAAAALLVASALGPELAQSAATGQAPLARAALLSSGQVVGSVSLYGGSPPVVEVRVDLGPSTGIGWLDCDAVSAGGSVASLGRIRLFGGRAAWAAPETVALDHLAGVNLVGPAGTVVASASLD